MKRSERWEEIQKKKDVFNKFLEDIAENKRSENESWIYAQSLEKKIINSDEISKLVKAFPKDIAALDKRSDFWNRSIVTVSTLQEFTSFDNRFTLKKMNFWQERIQINKEPCLAVT